MRVAARTWSETIGHLRHCGRRRVECVVYWTASLDARDLADEAVHPVHVSTAWYYEVQAAWLNAFMVRLHQARRTVVAQVHTHAEEAFHSATDDAWPLVRTPGFVSLVIPRFAANEFSAIDAYVAELDSAGRWLEQPVDRLMQFVP